MFVCNLCILRELHYSLEFEDYSGPQPHLENRLSCAKRKIIMADNKKGLLHVQANIAITVSLQERFEEFERCEALNSK